MEHLKVKSLGVEPSKLSIRFIPDKRLQTDGDLLVFNEDDQLKFKTRVQHFNPMELGMTHYCCDQKMEHCIPSDHLCEEGLIEVWI